MVRTFIERLKRLLHQEPPGAGRKNDQVGSAYPGTGGFVAPERLSDLDRLQEIKRLYSRYRLVFPGIVEISATEALELTAGGAVVFVDVRNPAEQEISMLPGAISSRELLANPEGYAGRPLVAYCTLGYRSARFVHRHAGRFRRLQNLEGGILSWLHAGGQVFHCNLPTRRVHVYGERWALQPAGYEPVF